MKLQRKNPNQSSGRVRVSGTPESVESICHREQPLRNLDVSLEPDRNRPGCTLSLFRIIDSQRRIGGIGVAKEFLVLGRTLDTGKSRRRKAGENRKD